MTRIHLPTNLKTRTGVPEGKDARIKNGYVEVKGEQKVVRKRPSAHEGIPIGTGTAQGGIAISEGGTSYIYTVNGDTGLLSAQLDFSDYSTQDFGTAVDQGPAETPYSVPATTVEYVTLGFDVSGNRIRKTITTTYAGREVTGQYRQTLVGSIVGGVAGVILPVINETFNHVYYGASEAACNAQADSAAIAIYPVSPTWSTHPTWSFTLNSGLSTYLASYHDYTDSEGPPGNATGLYGFGGATNEVTQLNIYYLDNHIIWTYDLI